MQIISNDDIEFQCLLDMISHKLGFDFREYRQTTLKRRLSRRMHARGAETYANYALILDGDPMEYNRFLNDFLINVTRFFRDEASFRALEEVVVPALISKAQKSIRVWCAGCSTGQESYSIAILLLNLLKLDHDLFDIRILATDIDAKALEQARQGFFTPKEVEDIPPAWLERYFVFENKGFQLKQEIRELVSFEIHNLIKDPYYYDMDLIVCRNVVIYFTSSFKERVLNGFNNVLKKGGFLLLGKTEVPMGKAKGLFQCVDIKSKLYQKMG